MEGDLSNDRNINNQQLELERRKNIAKKLLDGYSKRTGLSLPNNSNDNHSTLDETSRQRRYLWTDAFALANFISLMKKDDEDLHQQSHLPAVPLDCALNLIEAVHETLGKHRLDHKDPEIAGTWLLNASPEHPTAGGLRIGKLQDERPANVPYHSDTEWDRDGQYFHYLTKWGTALDMLTRRCNQPKYTIWAMELLHVAASRFVTHQYGRPQMYWKLSIDLSRPQVASQGARDALEGYILASRLISTCEQCQIFSPLLPNMFDCQRIFHSMICIAETDDPLELGGMFLDMCQLFLLEKQMGTDNHRKAILQNLKTTAALGIELYTGTNELKSPPNARTPFRELGLSLGLRAMERLFSCESKSSTCLTSVALSSHLNVFEEILLVHLPLAERIEAYWLDADHQSSKPWTNHMVMNEIMLACTLNPSCWLH